MPVGLGPIAAREMQEVAPPIAHVQRVDRARQTDGGEGDARRDAELSGPREDDGGEEGGQLEEVLHARFRAREGAALRRRDGALDDQLRDEVEGVETHAREDDGRDEEVWPCGWGRVEECRDGGGEAGDLPREAPDAGSCGADARDQVRGEPGRGELEDGGGGADPADDGRGEGRECEEVGGHLAGEGEDGQVEE